MKLNDKVYDALKWVALIGIPALAVAYTTLASIWGWGFADQINATANILCTLIGSLIGISTVSYNRK